MSRFNRRVDLAQLTPELAGRHGWFRALLARWRPAGKAPLRNESGQVVSLRLAIRGNNVMTFYAGGQQIAKVRCSPDRFRAKANAAFLQDERPARSVDIDVPSCPPGEEESELDKRIQRSLGKQGKQARDGFVFGEKVFVEELIGANENVFDIEIGLPGSSGAPRLDLLNLEPSGAGWRIAVWEAKLAANGGAKSRSASPLTVEQHGKYTRWFESPSNRSAFVAGARNSCRALCAVHDLALELGLDLPPLGKGIREVGAKADMPLDLDPITRYVIDLRADRSGAFTQNGHAGSLRNATQAHVQTVGKGGALLLDQA